jgi:hypothetical protein
MEKECQVSGRNSSSCGGALASRRPKNAAGRRRPVRAKALLNAAFFGRGLTKEV